MNYLYSSFYTSSAVVIGYLIRIEPFTSLHIELQSGHFDISSRLFSSIPRAWESVNYFTMDFRELIPEFYYFPDFLINSNGFDLGKDCFNDVELPPWASSPMDFIQKNREALESPYVTQNLNHWIDQIFGFSSRGPEAYKIDNVFSPNFYDTSITKEVINDPERFKFIREYSACFGAAPHQIFNEPHPSKKLLPSISSFSNKLMVVTNINSPILSLECIENKIFIINKELEFLTSYFYMFISKEKITDQYTNR